MADALLTAADLWKKHGTVQAVAGVSFDAHPGVILGILGPNGAGKSSLFRLLAGLDAPDRGRVNLGGVDVTRWPLHRRARAGLAYLPQHASLLPMLTVRENVGIAVGSVGGPPDRIDALLVAEDLVALADRPARFLSGGERRRAEIARCLGLSPTVVLLDEPFAGVDPAHVASLRARIRALADAGSAVILTDHNVREALPTCHRAIVLDGGSVQRTGTPEEIAADPTVRARYLGAGFRLDD